MMYKKNNWKHKIVVAVLLGALLLSPFAENGKTERTFATTRISIKNTSTGKLVIKKGNTLKLSTTIPKSCKVTWNSSKKSVVSVTPNGVIKGRKKGTAIISAKTARYGTKKIRVTVGIPVSKVRLFRKSYVTYIGGQTSLRPQILPANATDKKVVYRSSNKKVASVSAKGVITGKRRGKTTITIFSKDSGKKKATATVKVIESQDDVSLLDDYFQNINKDILATASLDVNTESWSALGDVQKLVNSRCEDIVKEAEEHAATNVDGSSEDNIAALELTGKDMESRDRNQASELQEYFTKIDGATNLNELMQLEGEFKKQGLKGILPMQVNTSVKDNKTYYLYFGYADNVLDLSVYKSAYYVDVKNAYRAFIKQLLVAAGEQDAVAEQHAQNIYNLQQNLNADLQPVVDGLTEDMTQEQQEAYIYSRMYLNYSIADINAALPSFDFSSYLNAAGYQDVKEIVVMLPEHVQQFANILTEDNLDTLKAMAKYKIMYQYAPFLDTAIYNSYSSLCDMLQKPLGKSVTEYADSYVNSIMSWDISKIYVQKYITTSEKQKITDMVNRVSDEYYNELDNCEWMSYSTQENAKKKISNLTKNVLYPDDFAPYLVESNLSIPAMGGTLVGNMKLLFAELEQADQSAVGRTLAGTDWISAPVTSNAWYYKYNNSITIPAGLIGDVVYNENRTDAQNYGSLGSIIGHEISHAFDLSGSQYDENGDEVNWWTKEDEEIFAAIQNQMAEYYNTFELVDGERVFENGWLTLSENIADLAGISCAVKLIPQDTKARNEFFVSYGNLWAEKMTEYATKYYAVRDTHANSRLRVNAVLPMVDEFYETYKIKSTDAMYVAPEKRITIW